ncbi:tape measure protein, partial [Clostridioides difficile]
IFRALEQMLSKGQVYAEELRGQLGERLPGAVALFAKGMNMTTTQLMKAMENGEVSGEAVINFAREQAKAIDAQLETASKGVDAMEARTRNAMTMFQLALADSGFIEAYVQLLQKVTDFLNSS